MEKPEQLGDGPIEAKFREQMNQLARFLDFNFNGDAKKGDDRKIGFVLMLFEFGDAGHTNYISNAKREDIVAMLKHQIARLEQQPEGAG